MGCDGIINSGLTLDKCGVCGGDSSSCRRYDVIIVRPTAVTLETTTISLLERQTTPAEQTYRLKCGWVYCVILVKAVVHSLELQYKFLQFTWNRLFSHLNNRFACLYPSFSWARLDPCNFSTSSFYCPRNERKRSLWISSVISNVKAVTTAFTFKQSNEMWLS